ncbi:ABC transporter ATP-binding protein [Mesorhizobium sp. Z1-4]|uniref:ABC transporter ATP-binding protein n=1 Tax=Mesorhizobium sp. Z1-4 TaxID=2448478 RepID=UPI000FDB545B|nr:ABC transporter ATP-binding protein [Mesorhizobium sp. Z1-4]
MSPLLSIRGLTAGYGGPPIIEDVSFDVAANEIAVILGPNGAGKSTVLKTIFALTKVLSGAIDFEGTDIASRKTSALVTLGMSAVPQSRNVFRNLTVDENLDVGTYAAPPADKAATREKILELFPDLRAKLKQPAGELSGGQRQMVAIGRAMMCEPKLILLDEPTAGLSPAYLERIFDLLLDIRKTGVTILMVEQNARQALQIADHGHVLVNGGNFASGTGKELLADEDVRRSFLGGTPE